MKVDPYRAPASDATRCKEFDPSTASGILLKVNKFTIWAGRTGPEDLVLTRRAMPRRERPARPSELNPGLQSQELGSIEIAA